MLLFGDFTVHNIADSGMKVILMGVICMSIEMLIIIVIHTGIIPEVTRSISMVNIAVITCIEFLLDYLLVPLLDHPARMGHIPGVKTVGAVVGVLSQIHPLLISEKVKFVIRIDLILWVIVGVIHKLIHNGG